MDDLVKEIREYRSGICKTFLITLAIIAIPALFASLYRIANIGWQPVMALHIAIALLLWLMTVFRNSVPYAYQAGFIVLIFYAIGLGGLIQFGLIAGGVVFLVMASPIATLLFGGRIGMLVLVIALLSAAIIGLLTVNGTLVHGFDVASYATASASWLTSITGWMLAGTALTASIYVFDKKLIDSLRVSREQQEKLTAQKLILEQTISEKEKALSEVKTLQGIIPICSYCHKIRSDEGAWDQLESYISKHSDATFSHGICPSCLEEVREQARLDDD